MFLKVQPLKIVLKMAHFRVTGKHFLRPCAKLISNISKKHFVFGVLKQFGTTFPSAQFSLSQKSLHPIPQPSNHPWYDGQTILSGLLRSI